MSFIAISLTLLTILAALHYLIKVKTEIHPAVYRWAGYLVLVVAGAILVCELSQGVIQMMHHRGKAGTHCGNGNFKRIDVSHGNCGSHHGSFSGMGDCGMSSCGNHGGNVNAHNKKRMKFIAEQGDSIVELITDTTDGKLIRKEIRVIKEN